MHGGPSIVDLEDLPWMEVSKIRFSDGRVVGIREKWIELSPRYLDEIGAEELSVPRPTMPIWMGTGDVLPKSE